MGRFDYETYRSTRWDAKYYGILDKILEEGSENDCKKVLVRFRELACKRRHLTNPLPGARRSRTEDARSPPGIWLIPFTTLSCADGMGGR